MNDPLNRQIVEFGTRLLSDIRKNRPSVFNKNFWGSSMMLWSMDRPEIKTNLFRLVDVLPTLRTTGEVVAHIREYLGDTIASFSPALAWGLRGSPKSMRGRVSAVAVRHAVNQMASLFIAGESPSSALKRLHALRREGFAYTVDLLGEFSVSEKESLAYLERYLDAIRTIAEAAKGWKDCRPIIEGHAGEQTYTNVSVKLTALYSQCSPLNFDRSVSVLSARLSQIARAAKESGAAIYVDAEDSGNNPIIYQTFKEVFGSSEFKDFPYPGIVVQAYARDSQAILENLLSFASRRGNPIAVRLVKGAYWDYEKVIAQQQHWPFPLFTSKEDTDAHYEELSRLLLNNTSLCLPAFASHNVRSLAHACCFAEQAGVPKRAYELQMLYGMAEPIAKAFAGQGQVVRLYVPLGDTVVGMGYLVRRLLENSSNEGFLKHAFHDTASPEALLRQPQKKELPVCV